MLWDDITRRYWHAEKLRKVHSTTYLYTNFQFSIRLLSLHTCWSPSLSHAATLFPAPSLSHQLQATGLNCDLPQTANSPQGFNSLLCLLEATLVTHARKSKVRPRIFPVNAELSHARHPRRPASLIGINVVFSMGGRENWLGSIHQWSVIRLPRNMGAQQWGKTAVVTWEGNDEIQGWLDMPPGLLQDTPRQNTMTSK